jgi:hypothetical protein
MTEAGGSQIHSALLNLEVHSRVHGRRTCGFIANRVLCIYRSVILHRGGDDDSNVESSRTVNKET